MRSALHGVEERDEVLWRSLPGEALARYSRGGVNGAVRLGLYAFR
jgi:hypothetical protein